MNRKRPLFWLLILCLTFACNLPGVAPAKPTETPRPTALTTATFGVMPTLVLTLVPTRVPATATANAEISCLTGPGSAYELVIKLNAGESVPIVGKAASYWLVKPGLLRECWVDSQFVTVTGDTSTVAEIVPPAVPTLGPPAAPVSLVKQFGTCTPIYTTKPPIYITKYEIEYFLTWVDNSNNEDGFYVYRDSNRVAELAANVTQLTDTFTVRSGGKAFYYYVVAYNSLGQTESAGLSIATPCH